MSQYLVPNTGCRKIAYSLALLLVLSSALTVAAQEGGAEESGTGPIEIPHVASAAIQLKLSSKFDITRIGDRGVGDGINLFSLKKEREWGESMSRKLDTQLQFVTDPELNSYVNRLVQRLVMNSDAKVPFTVRVVKNEQVNAFSLPGGFLYVDTGLIAASPDEATLAGILAHEVAHVAARHVTKAMTRRTLMRMGTIPLMFWTGGIAAAVDNAVGIAIPMSNLKFTRDSEKEADLLGLEYAYAAGYDPEAFVQFFESLEARQKVKIPRLVQLMYSSHPMTGDRIKRAQAAIATMLPAKSDYVVDTSEFQQAQARLFELTDPCRYANGRPVLLGAGKTCRDPVEPDGRPKLRRKKKSAVANALQ